MKPQKMQEESDEIKQKFPRKDKCTLSDEELLEKCEEWVSKLAHSGGHAWILSVPVNFNNDPDMLFSELGRRFRILSEQKSRDEKPTNNDWISGKTTDELPIPGVVLTFKNPESINDLIHSLIELQKELFEYVK